MKGALMAVGIQLLVWFIAWRAWSAKPVPPESVLKDAAFCFFFWWLVIPVAGVAILNEWTTEYVKRRRAGVTTAPPLRSGQENGLYD